jgi:hypothetical protein
VAKTKKKRTDTPRKTRAARKGSGRNALSKAPGKNAVPLREAHLRWLSSVAQSIRVNGGPSLTAAEVLGALIDAATSRRIDPRAVRDLEALRVAFGAFDTREVEAQLRERPSVEPSVLDALKDSIK